MRNVLLVHSVRLSDLEKERDDNGVEDPVQFDEEPEGAARHGQVSLGSQLSHSELRKNKIPTLASCLLSRHT